MKFVYAKCVVLHTSIFLIKFYNLKCNKSKNLCNSVKSFS